MSTKGKILKILNQTHDYVSGQAISETLGISRAAVNTAIKSLKEQGYEISSVSNRGYRLIVSPDLLTAEETGLYLDDERMERVKVLDTVDSTNAELMRMAATGTASDGFTVLSDEQTAGRGRKSRAFISKKGMGLYLSYLFKPSQALKKQIADSGNAWIWSSLTSWAAVAASDAVEACTADGACPRHIPHVAASDAVEACTCQHRSISAECDETTVSNTVGNCTGVRPDIKWVNDLYLNGRKIAGILTQVNSSAEIREIEGVVIGIGINTALSYEDLPEDIKGKAGSIFAETGIKVRRARLAAELIMAFDHMISVWPAAAESYYERYIAYSNVIGRNVTITDSGYDGEAYVIGIDRDYRLIVKDTTGTERTIIGGDVSLRL